MNTRSIVSLSLLSLVLLACDGASSSSDASVRDGASTPDAAVPTGRATLVGQVFVAGAVLEPLLGAVVEVGGASTTTDELGRYTLTGLPPGAAIVRVRGPRPDPSVDPRAFGTREVAVTLVDDDVVTRSVSLMAGCERMVDGASAVTIDLTGCGATGSLALPAHAFVDAATGAAHDGDVLIEIAVLDPSAEAAFLALPDAPTGEVVRAAIEVRPLDPDTRAELQLAPSASATIVLPADDGDLTRTVTWDASTLAWMPHPSSVRRIGASTAEITASHFCVCAVLGSPPAHASRGCVHVRPQLCDPSGGCRTASVDMAVYAGSLSAQHVIASDACIDVPLATTTRIEFRWVNPLAAAILGTPMYFAVTSVAPSTEAQCSDTYDARTCVDLPVMLRPVVTTCVSGRIALPTGEGVVGPVRVLAGETHVASTILPASCDGRFCLEVPWGQGPLTLESAWGTLPLDPPVQGVGGTCDRTMPMPAVACSAVTQTNQCDTGVGTFTCNDPTVCALPLRAIASDLGPSGCSGGERLLSVTSTGGGTPWFFEAHVATRADMRHVAIFTSTSRTLAGCVPPGDYVVELAADLASGGPLLATTQVVVGGTSGMLTVLADGGGRVVSTPTGIDCGATCSAPFAVGTMVTLRAFDDMGTPVAVSWTGDCMSVDGTSSAPTATVRVSGAVNCRALFPTPRWYISLPPVGTQTPSSVFTVRPEAWDAASASYRPIVDVVPDVARCEWQVGLDGVIVATPTTVACGPLLFGPASVMPDIALRTGNYQLTVTAYRADGTASEPASGGFGVF